MSMPLSMFMVLSMVCLCFAGPSTVSQPVEELTSAIKQVTHAMEALSGATSSSSSGGSGEATAPVVPIHVHVELPTFDGIPNTWSADQMKEKGTGPHGEGTCCFQLKVECDGDKPGIYYDSTYRESDLSVEECMARASAAEEECSWSKDEVANNLILRWGPKNFPEANQAEAYCNQEVFKG